MLKKSIILERGFTIVEIIIVMGLTLVFLLGTSSLFYLAVRSSVKASLAAQGKALAEEGMEALIAIRDIAGSQWDWTATPTYTAANEYYQPYLSGSSWVLGNKLSTSPVPTMDPPHQAFTRTVTIEQVQRAVGCGSTVCSIVTQGGVNDANTKKVVITVKWAEEDGLHVSSLSSYLLRWR